MLIQFVKIMVNDFKNNIIKLFRLAKTNETEVFTLFILEYKNGFVSRFMFKEITFGNHVQSYAITFIICLFGGLILALILSGILSVVDYVYKYFKSIKNRIESDKRNIEQPVSSGKLLTQINHSGRNFKNETKKRINKTSKVKKMTEIETSVSRIQSI